MNQGGYNQQQHYENQDADYENQEEVEESNTALVSPYAAHLEVESEMGSGFQ